MVWVACLTRSAAIEWFTLCNVTIPAAGQLKDWLKIG
jgi:hypothetical protein